MNVNKFKVGSHVWFVRDDKPAIYHYLVVEEIVKNSINGSSRDYVFEMKTPNNKTQKVISQNIQGNYFSERTDAYNFMLEHAGIAINQMMDRAEYKTTTEELIKPSIDPGANKEKNIDEAIIELPDGTKARLKGGIPK